MEDRNVFLSFFVNTIKQQLDSLKYNLEDTNLILKEALYEFVKNKLSTKEEYTDEVVINLKMTGKIVEEKIDNKEWIFLEEFYRIEKNIATRLYMMQKTQNIKHIKSFNSFLDKEESLLAITLSPKQKEALKQVNKSNVSIITGGPGTRKNNNYKSFNRYI